LTGGTTGLGVGIAGPLAARHGDALLRALVETAVDGVIVIDRDGRVLLFNPACERLFGYRAAEVLGRNVRMLMPPPFRAEHDAYVERYLETGERRIIGIGREVQGQRRDGSAFPMQLSVGETEVGGERVFVGILHDISERKRTQEQLAQALKMEAVGQLSGGLAHDFNNLLTVIVGNADLLSEHVGGQAEAAELVHAIVTAGERGAELTQRLLAFSRRQTLEPAEVDCSALVGETEALLRRTLRADIDLRCDAEAGLWPAFADPTQLQAALLNLALNAQDAMPAGGTLTIATSNMPLEEGYGDGELAVRPGRYVLIAVTDDGEGMPAEVAKRAFEPFFTTKGVGKGSGLGLSMVYGFVVQSGGHLGLYSEPGLGTTIRLYLPAAVDAVQAGAVARADAEAERPEGLHGRTVLVAEDDAFVRSYALACLKRLGCRALAAENGHAALAVLRREPAVDLLFTDVVMAGGMDGWELADRARGERPGLRVLVASGYALESLAARGRMRPDVPVLNKPYRPAELARRIRQALA